MADQLQYIVKMFERKTATKDGSKASVGEFNRFFSFSIFPAEAWLTAPENLAFRNSAHDLIRAHQSDMKSKRDAGSVKGVEHVQGDSKKATATVDEYLFSWTTRGDQIRTALFMQNYQPFSGVHQVQR